MLIVLVCVACDNTPPPTPAPNARNAPTNPAPAWTESAAPITLDNIASIRLLGRLDQPNTLGTIFAHSLSPDATVLAALNNDETLAWDLLTGGLIFTTSRFDATQIFYASDKSAVFLVDAEGTVRLLDVVSGAESADFAGQPTYNGVSAFDADSDRLALGGTDGTIKVWDVFARQSLITFTAQDAASLTALAFSPDGTHLASAYRDGMIRVWEWEADTLIAELAYVGDPPPAVDQAFPVGIRLQFSPDATRLGIGTDRDVRLWQVGTETPPTILRSGRGGVTPMLLFSPDSAFVIAGNRSDGLALWRGDDGGTIVRLPLDTTPNSPLELNADFSPDGTMLVTASPAGTVRLFNIAEASSGGVGVSILPTSGITVFDLEWTDDGRLILLFDTNGAIYAWGIA